MPKHVHIVGAGLAGLSAAVECVQYGYNVTVYETAPQAGGRCRSYHDAQLGQVIDNGNHLVLSGNTSVARYCDTVGAEGWHVAEEARFPFFDVDTGESWDIHINDGRVPTWMFNARSRAPGTSARDYLAGIKILLAGQSAVLADVLRGSSPAYKRFWEPLILAVLNTPLDHAAAALLKPVFRETLLKGGAYCRPMIARSSLSDALIDPALIWLASHGVKVRFGQKVQALEFTETQVTALKVDGATIEVGAKDAVILAVPAWLVPTLAPFVDAPPAGEGILNIHYAFQTGEPAVRFRGLVSSLAQWVFVRSDAASVTVSAAGRAMAERPDDLAKACWAEICASEGWDKRALPPYRVIKEKRATFDQSPEALKKRTGPATQMANMVLAGDWTDSGLPATIEGAIRSGARAADLIVP